MPFASVDAIQLEGAQAGAEAVEKNITANGTFTIEGAEFDGTIGDLKLKHPEIYDKLVIQSIAHQICQQIRQAHDHFMEEMKRQRNNG